MACGRACIKQRASGPAAVAWRCLSPAIPTGEQAAVAGSRLKSAHLPPPRQPSVEDRAWPGVIENCFSLNCKLAAGPAGLPAASASSAPARQAGPAPARCGKRTCTSGSSGPLVGSIDTQLTAPTGTPRAASRARRLPTNSGSWPHRCAAHAAARAGHAQPLRWPMVKCFDAVMAAENRCHRPGRFPP